MNNSELLKDFYNTKIKFDGDPEFEKLDFNFKLKLYDTFGFATYRLYKSLADLGTSILLTLRLHPSPKNKNSSGNHT